jgi:hypothetical protein
MPRAAQTHFAFIGDASTIHQHGPPIPVHLKALEFERLDPSHDRTLHASHGHLGDGQLMLGVQLAQCHVAFGSLG